MEVPTTTAKSTSAEGLTTTDKSTSAEGLTTTDKRPSFEMECLSLNSSFYYDGSCFVERLEKLMYVKAKKSCKDMSPKFPKGHLAHVKSQKLIDMMEKNFKKRTIQFFLGFAQKDRRDEPAGHSYWIDEEGKFLESADESLKELWNKKDPNNYKNTEDCGTYYYNAGMPEYQMLNDWNCNFELPFICQYHE